MARTTGYTATGIARLIALGKFKEIGVSPPEAIGANENCFSFLLSLLAERNISIQGL